jgi:hypothetical protein
MFAIAIAEEGEEGLGDWGFEMILFARLFFCCRSSREGTEKTKKTSSWTLLGPFNKPTWKVRAFCTRVLGLFVSI